MNKDRQRQKENGLARILNLLILFLTVLLRSGHQNMVLKTLTMSIFYTTYTAANDTRDV